MRLIRYCLLLLLWAFNATASDRPNIVIVLADDIGSGDISYYSQRFFNKKPVFDTPNIDLLAQQGMSFTDGHSATALCSPTRYAIMSGKNNYRSYAPWGVWGMFQQNAIAKSDPTLGRVAQDAGYKTAFIGKWHLGGDFKIQGSEKIFRGDLKQNHANVDLTQFVGGGARDLGFDYSFLLPDGIQGPEYLAYENDTWYPLSKESKITHLNYQNVYQPKMISDKGEGMGDSHWRTEDIGDVLSTKAESFLLQNAGKKPFMLFYASPMAHLPHMPPAHFNGQPLAGTTGSAHMDMIKELDMQVGRIIAVLKQQGVFDNTLFIFTSDNGGLGYQVPGTYESGHRVSGIYRESKNSPFEGGHRVPFVVHWPKHVAPESVSDEPVIVQDILATVGSVAGNMQTQQQAPDSNDLLPLLLNTGEFKPREYLMLQGGSMHEVIFRKGYWKLIMKSNPAADSFIPVALFNLDNNITEQESANLINQADYKIQVQQLLNEYLSIRHSAQPTSPLWTQK